MESLPLYRPPSTYLARPRKWNAISSCERGDTDMTSAKFGEFWTPPHDSGSAGKFRQNSRNKLVILICLALNVGVITRIPPKAVSRLSHVNRGDEDRCRFAASSTAAAADIVSLISILGGTRFSWWDTQTWLKSRITIEIKMIKHQSGTFQK